MTNEAHIRIDEGVKRGPRYKHKLPRRSPKADLGTWVIPADLNPDTVIERYLTESTTSQIAAQYGLSRKALVRWLREQRPKQWNQVQVIRALCRIEDAENGIDCACDALSLARARESLKAGQWTAERLDSANYGQQITQTIEVNHHITVDQALIEDARELMKSMRGAIAQPSQIIDLQPDAGQQSDLTEDKTT